MEKYVNLIRKICHSFAQTSNIEYEELYSEAVLCYYETHHKYNKDSGVKKSTWLYRVISNHLITFIKNEQRHAILNGMDIAFTAQYMEDFCSEFSTIGKQLKDIIFENECLFTFDKSAKFNRGILVKVLRENMQWSWPMIWRAISIIKTDLNNTHSYSNDIKGLQTNNFSEAWT